MVELDIRKSKSKTMLDHCIDNLVLEYSLSHHYRRAGLTDGWRKFR